MQGPVHPNFLHSTNHGSGHADAGNSFLALLYGPPSLLQCDFQELSDRKICTSSSNCTPASGNSVDSIESGAFITSGGRLITENLINHNLQGCAYTLADISSRAMVGLNSGGNFVLNDIWSSNTDSQHTFPGGDKARESFASRGQCHVTSLASNLNVCCSNIQTTSKMALEQCSPKNATSFVSGCPRVFCMGKCGYLLLSNTGLLGIICSCHCCHMSVLKFCEHSGLHDVNPGDAVYMESGETIAQWRKLYFLKFGIRSPGNENEWDWPEVLSTTGSLMKSNASGSDMSKSDLPHILSSSAVTLRSGKSSDYVMFPKNAHTDHNLFIGALSSKQITTIQDNCNIPLKGFTGISQSLCERVKNQLLESNLAAYTTAPNIGGTQLDDGCQPITPFLDSLKRNGNVLIAHSPTQTPTSLLKEHECIKKKNAKDCLVGRDAASSNIELRLGQPPQTGNPVQSYIEPPLFNALASPPKLQPLKQMINNLRREEELQSNFSCTDRSFEMVEEQPQLKPRNYMSGVGNASGAARTENVAKRLLFSPFLQFNPQHKGKTKTSQNVVNDGGPMHKKLHSEYSTMQFGRTNVLYNSNGHTGRQLNNSAPGSNKFLDNDKGVNFAKNSCALMNSEFRISELMEFGSITRAVDVSDSCISAVNGKINDSSLPSDTSVGANFLQGSKNVSSFGQDNNVTSGTAIPFEGILKGLPYLVSSSMANQTPLLQQRDINMDTYRLDENMRLLTSRQILELSKQQHALYFHDMNQKQKRSNNISKAQHHIYEASTSVQGLNRYYQLPSLAPIPLHFKVKESQCKCSHDLRNDEPSLSLGIDKDRSSACEKCSEQPSDIHLVGKHTRAAPVNCSGRTFYSGIGPSHYILKQQFENACGETYFKTASKCSRDQNALKDENIHFEQVGKLDGQGSIKFGSHTPQWRDVPSKVRKAACDATSLDQTATVLDCEGQDSVQPGNISAKRLKKTNDVEDLLKEQENFNVSSGCSTAVVSQASVEVNRVDSCTVDAVDTGCVNNLVVDEGSGIEKGWSSDVVESERSAEFLGSTDSNTDAGFHTLPEVSETKKLRKDLTSECSGHFQMQELSYLELENAKLKSFSSRKANAHRITRPVVCGKYGEISSGQLTREIPKPAKIVSLSKVLKTSKSGMVLTNGKPRLTSKKKWKRLSFGTSGRHCRQKPGIETKEDNESQNTTVCNETNVDLSMEGVGRGSKPHVIYEGKRDIKIRQGDCIVNRADAPLKPKSKEIRKQRSINELTAIENKVKDILKYAEDREHGLYDTKSRNSVQQHTSISIINSDPFCCVHNSITAGVLDTTIKQWVHMVCGLWTPGTRCPNVDTMSAFDVSEVSRPRADVMSQWHIPWGGGANS
ncbi:Jas TPL-binding domain [Sesbania bispinosa]|nr:Jas TPL-binding domain [Sesbania bispinosa]